MLRPYVAFNAALRSAYHNFVHNLEERCKMLLEHQLQVPYPSASAGSCPLSTLDKESQPVKHKTDLQGQQQTQTRSSQAVIGEVCMQAGTSEFAMAALSSSETGDEEIEEEPVYHREPLAPLGSQMTVPETPSPDILEYKYKPGILRNVTCH